MNKALRETAKRQKLGVVEITVNGRYMDPPRSEITAEVSVSEAMMGRAYLMLVELLADHDRISGDVVKGREMETRASRENLAEIGEALLESIRINLPDYSWGECPSEVVVYLLNENHDLKQRIQGFEWAKRNRDQSVEAEISRRAGFPDRDPYF